MSPGTPAEFQALLRRHDAGEPGYGLGEEKLFPELLALLGWQGGTVWQALAEARKRAEGTNIGG